MKTSTKEPLATELDANTLTASDARTILIKALPVLDEPLKSAVEFTLINWKILIREPRASDVAINFFASLPSLPSNDVDLTFAAKLNEMAKLLRDDPDVWLCLDDLPHEEWRDVICYEGLYQISNFGRIKSFQRGKIMIISPAKCGRYSYATLFRPNYRKNFFVHTLVTNAFHRNLENKPQVNHINGDKRNNCAWNLEWVTSKENINHAIKLGLMKPKNPNPPKEIPEDIKRYILKNYKRWDRRFGTKAMVNKFNLPFKTLKRFLRENHL